MLFNSLWSVRLQKRKPNYFKLQNEILQKLHLCFKGSKCWSHDDSNYFTIDYGALQTIILNTFCKKKKKKDVEIITGLLFSSNSLLNAAHTECLPSKVSTWGRLKEIVLPEILHGMAKSTAGFYFCADKVECV